VAFIASGQLSGRWIGGERRALGNRRHGISGA
jgi:hypothetical protein